MNWRIAVAVALLVETAVLSLPSSVGLSATATADAWFGIPSQTQCSARAFFSATAEALATDGSGTVAATGEWTVGIEEENQRQILNFPPNYRAHVDDDSGWIGINDGQQATASAKAVASSLTNPAGSRDQTTDAVECVIINLP